MNGYRDVSHQWEGWRKYQNDGEPPPIRRVAGEELESIEPPRPASEYLSVGRRVAFFSGGVVANLLTVFLLVWLSTQPTRPDRALARTATMVGRAVTILPLAIAEQVNPDTYTSDRPGLLRSVRDDDDGGHLVKPLTIISLLLGVFNLVPVPPLDGFRIVEAGYERIVGRPPPPTIARWLYTIGGLILAAFILSGIYLLGRDVTQMLRGR